MQCRLTNTDSFDRLSEAKERQIRLDGRRASAYGNREQAREGQGTSTETERFQSGFTMRPR